MIKLLIGGSPCTFWSIAQKNGRETEAEGLGWELFKNYLIAKEKFKPDLFLYENNKSAAQPIKDQICRELGVDLMYINSALVSAQNRQRFYCFNWEVDQPEDRGILLRDILESGVSDRDKARCVTASVGSPTHREYFLKQQNTMAIEPVCMRYERSEKQKLLRKQYEAGNVTHGFRELSELHPRPDGKTNTLSTVLKDNLICEPVGIGWSGSKCDDGKWQKQYDSLGEEKANALTTAVTESMVEEPIRVGGMPRPNGELSTSQAKRVYSIDGKSVNLTANGGGEGAKTGMCAIPEYNPYAELVEWDENGKPTKDRSGDDNKVYPVYEVKDGIITIKDKQYPIKLPDGIYIIRKLTPVECERLQTLPDGYTRAVSDAQRYKGLGNGWTAEVIIHILNGALKDVPRDEEIVVLSMYDGIGTGRYCLDKMGFTNVKYFAYEIDKYAKQVALSNYPDIVQMGDAFDLRNPDWTIGY